VFLMVNGVLVFFLGQLHTITHVLLWWIATFQFTQLESETQTWCEILEAGVVD
jgi:hypothetical protein